MKRRFLLKSGYIFLCLALVSALLPATVLGGTEPPMLRYGYAYINGQLAEDGTLVQAKIGGEVVASCNTTTLEGINYALAIEGESGDRVYFFVLGIEAEESPISWESGGRWQDLHVIVVTPYNLTMEVVGNGTVTPAEGEHSYPNGTVVDITATPDTYWDFVNWTTTGDLSEINDPDVASTTVVVDKDKTVTANFAQVNYTLNMTKTGNGTTTPAEGEHSYINGTVVNITATPDAYWDFVNWTGEPIDGNTTLNPTITMNDNYTIMANFAVTPTYFTLNMTVTGNGNVTINDTITPTSYPNTTSWAYDTVVNLTATPDAYWDFVNWTGEVANNTSPSTNVTVDANKTVTANFVPMPVLNVTATPATVTVSVPTDVTFNVTSDGAAVEGATVNLSGVATGTNTTGADGLCLISVNATSAGTINVTASKTGYVDGNTTIMAVPRYLNVTATPATVTVSVPTDVTFNVTSDGAAVEGATVNLSGVATGTNTTGGDGLCIISVNATSAGIINVTASKTGYTNGTTTIKAVLGYLNVTASTANVTAGVPTDVTFNVTSDGTAVNSATVNLSGVATGTNTTGADGLCIISVNATSAGTINVTASKTGYTNGTTTITAHEALEITTTSLPEGKVGDGYNATLEASGGTTPYTWNITAGELPGGLSLAVSTGVISGTPTTNGTFNFTAEVTDSFSPANTAEKELFIEIIPVCVNITFSISLASGWNYISLPLIPEDSDIEVVLQSVEEKYIDIWAYNAANSTWQTYKPGAPSEYYAALAELGITKLDKMADGIGYIINMTQSAHLTGIGLEYEVGAVLPPTYPVYESWNLVGFKTMDFNSDCEISQADTMRVGYYLCTMDKNLNGHVVGNEVTYLRYYEPADGEFHELSDADDMFVGYGYWLYAMVSGEVAPPIEPEA